MKNSLRFVLPLGLATFAIMFGAGNIIYPPLIGFQSNSNWILGTLMFIITSIGFAMVGNLALVYAPEGHKGITRRIHKNFDMVFFGLVYTIIGPLFAIPRTSIVTNKFFTSELLGDVIDNPFIIQFISSSVFFALTAVLIFKGGSIVETVGKYLTPVLLALLGIVIAAAVIKPYGSIAPADGSLDSTIANGLRTGYMTLDGVAYFVMFNLAFKYIVIDNETTISKPQRNSIALKATLVAGGLLLLVYLGLGYFGALGSDQAIAADGPAILKRGIDFHFGTAGKIIFGTLVALACLTTSIGLSENTARFFGENLKVKHVNFKSYLVIGLIVSFLLSLFNLDDLTVIIVPILLLAYPIAAFIAVFAIAGIFIRSDKIIIHSFIITCFISALSFIAGSDTFSDVESLSTLQAGYRSSVPLANVGLDWLPMLLLVALGAIVIDKLSRKKHQSKGEAR